MVTAVARDVDTCVAHHRNGVPNDIYHPILSLDVHIAPQNEKNDAIGGVGSKMSNLVVDVDEAGLAGLRDLGQQFCGRRKCASKCVIRQS